MAKANQVSLKAGPCRFWHPECGMCHEYTKCKNRPASRVRSSGIVDLLASSLKSCLSSSSSNSRRTLERLVYHQVQHSCTRKTCRKDNAK